MEECRRNGKQRAKCVLSGYTSWPRLLLFLWLAYHWQKSCGKMCLDPWVCALCFFSTIRATLSSTLPFSRRILITVSRPNPSRIPMRPPLTSVPGLTPHPRVILHFSSAELSWAFLYTPGVFSWFVHLPVLCVVCGKELLFSKTDSGITSECLLCSVRLVKVTVSTHTWNNSCWKARVKNQTN